MFYLVSKGTSIGEAALRVSGLELGGLLGSVSSGWLSDALIQSRPHAGVVGCRVRVALLYLLGSAAAIAAFYACPVTPNLLALQWAIFASVGFFLYGPQLLVGLSGAELVAPTCAGTRYVVRFSNFIRQLLHKLIDSCKYLTSYRLFLSLSLFSLCLLNFVPVKTATAFLEC